MFSKAIVLLLLAASTIAGAIPEGTYRIINVESHSSARVYNAGGQIFVSSTRENPGPFELWTLKNAEDNGYTIDNVGLNMIKMLDTFAAVREPMNGEPVVTNRNPTVFDIESAGNGAFVIKLQNDDSLWNVEPPVIPRGNVVLRPADGSATQRWSFTPVQSELTNKGAVAAEPAMFSGGFGGAVGESGGNFGRVFASFFSRFFALVR